MLIRLYALPDRQAPTPLELRCRKPIGAERDLVVDWVAREFTPGWAAEARAGLANRPVSVVVAMRDNALIGFCCYDTTALGLVGPIGVAAGAQGQGVGAALLRACLRDMRAVGYAYAVAGGVGVPEFFRRVAGAVEIEGSTPGPYQDMLRP